MDGWEPRFWDEPLGGEMETNLTTVEEKQHFVNARNIRSLLNILPLKGMEAELTVKVSIQELQKLPPEKLEAFLDAVATIAISCKAKTANGDSKSEGT